MFQGKTSKSTENNSRELFELEDNKLNISDFEIIKVIGSGRFGRVHLAKDKEDGLIVAIKMYEKFKIINEKMELALFNEIYHHSQVNHPHINKMFGFFHGQDMIYLVLEYAENGSMFDKLLEQKHKRFTEVLSAKYVSDIADGLKYCHSLNFFHGDLKPENVLLDAHGNAKITDFGLSWPLDNTSLIYRGCYHGTLEYMAPELFNKESYNEKIDHWSLGIICYEFLVGKTAFYSKRKSLIVQRILNVDLKFPKVVSKGAQDLINKLLRFSPEDRLPLKDVMVHKWINHNL